MKYISITGHISCMNHVVSRYLSRYDIQLEEAPVYPGQMEAFAAVNPYDGTLQKAENFLKMLGSAPQVYIPMTGTEAVNLVEAAQMAHDQRSDKLRLLEEERTRIGAYINRLQPFRDFDAPISAVESMANIHHRFGRMPTDHFRQYETFLDDDEKILLHVCRRGKEFVWVVYFTPVVYREVTDSVFSSLNFEAIPLTAMNPQAAASPSDVAATFPNTLLRYWHGRQVALEIEIAALTRQGLEEAVGSKERLCIACEMVKTLHAAFDVKKHAALSRGRRIFTFVGWMAECDAKNLEEEIDGDELAVFTRYGETADAPPIRLKNPPIIRQFEFFTRLYGLPAYDEIDPTPLLAVTYTLLFGLMFGDVGHGLVLAVLGLYIFRRGKQLGSILAIVGASSVVFGFLYGSIFGFEDVLPALWRRPMADITGTLLFAVGIGVGLIVLSMCLHMYNAVKARRVGDFLFGANGVAGLLFYSAVLWLAYRALFGGYRITLPVMSIAALPLVFVAFKGPIVGFIERQAAGFEDIGKGLPLPQPRQAVGFDDNGKSDTAGIGMTVFNMIIELFETLLTYATNTISFVRVGAFAISHAGMMHVVLQLSQGAAGSHNILILVLGNIVVMAIEGLLVGIQVLRLDFYEIFSRFYTGGGRGFASDRVKRW